MSRDSTESLHPPPRDAWRVSCARVLSLDRPRLVAIINVTPDSFSDAGRSLDPIAAVDNAHAAAEEGADALDIGAESTRPGAAPVHPDEQVRRLIPVLNRLRASSGPASNLPISVDTTRASAARAALDAGADAVNDQSACTDDPDMLTLIAERRAGLIMMHRLKPPAQDTYSHTYASEPDYGPDGVAHSVRAYLSARATAARLAGVAVESIILDPGLGFGKSVKQNWALHRALPAMHELGHPVLCALSRKSFIGAAMVAEGEPLPPPERRIAASVAAALTLAHSGVRLFRVHDVAAHRDALRDAGILPPARP